MFRRLDMDIGSAARRCGAQRLGQERDGRGVVCGKRVGRARREARESIAGMGWHALIGVGRPGT
jgi:hypothetical protein